MVRQLYREPPTFERTAWIRRLAVPRRGKRWCITWRTPVMPTSAFFYVRTKREAASYCARFLTPWTASIRKLPAPLNGMRWLLTLSEPMVPMKHYFYARTKRDAEAYRDRFLALPPSQPLPLEKKRRPRK